MSSFNVIPLPKPKEDNNNKLKEPLPKLHTLFIGSTGSGKTNLILNMILRNRMYGYLNYYKKIYIISPSSCVDSSFDNVDLYINAYDKKKQKKGLGEIELIDTFSSEIVEEIIDEITELYVPNGDRTLILLDDCINELPTSIKPVQMLFTRGRHMKISVWLSSQAYKKIPKVLRLNAHDVIVFGDQNKRDIKDIYSEFGSGEFNEFYKMYKHMTRKKYDFLQIRARYGDEERYVRNFNKN